MALFTSKREKRLWILAAVVTVAIYITAVIAQPVAGFLRENGLLEISFVFGLVLVIAAILTQRVKTRPGLGELGVWLGVAAVYLLMFVRMEIPEERTHIIEYGVLAALIYEAFAERKCNQRDVPIPALLTVAAVAILGVIDECIQYFIPNRVFDLRDMGFNALAGFMAVMASMALTWINRRK